MKLVRLKDFSGEACSIYSVLEDDGIPKYQKFLNELHSDYTEELININGRIKSIGKYGALEDYFKLEEWKHDERICCLYDEPDSELRLFCVRFENEKIVVLGSGGPKPKSIRAWQDDLKLEREGNLIITISDILRKKIELNLIHYSHDSLKLLGDLNIP